MKKFDQVCAWLFVVLGLLHCSGTFAFYRPLRVSAVWFFGSGVAIIVVGFCNIARIRHSSDTLLRALSVAANLLAVLFVGGFIWLIGSGIKSAPQAIVLAAIIVIELVFSVTTQ